MDKFRLENEHCISDTDWIPIRPLTLVLGRNSSGKSSFVRWLQLLKQSWSTPGTAPIVWTAQGGVDFGSFSEALRDGAQPAEIRYGFQVKHQSGVAELRVALAKNESSTEVRRIEIRLPDRVKIALEFPEGSDKADVLIDDRPANQLAPGWDWYRRGKGPLQRVQGFQDSESDDAEDYPAKQRLVAALTGLKSRKMDSWRIDKLASDVDWVNGGLQEQLAQHSAGTPTWKQNIRSMKPGNPIFAQLLSLYAVGEMDSVLDDLYRATEESLRRLTYVAPFRAEPERDRRNPEPSATLDSKGSALIPFLEALAPKRFRSLSDFVGEALGWGLELNRSGPMVELHVSERDLPRRNIADVGFGVGQVLPALCISGIIRRRRLNAWFEAAGS